MPSGVMTSRETRMISRMPTPTTKQSKRLKRDMKKVLGPSAYNWTNISRENRTRSTLVATSDSHQFELVDKRNEKEIGEKHKSKR